MYPELGNTVALALNPFSATKGQVRVEFEYYDLDEGRWGALDAVYCKDLYSEQIEAELTSIVKTSFFSDTFNNYYPFGEEDDGVAWICPDILAPLDITYNYPLRVKAVPCKDAVKAVYAASKTCDPSTFGSDLELYMQLVSTNLAADDYFGEK